MRETEKVLEKALIKIKPDNEEIKELDKELKIFTRELKRRIKELKIKAEIFVGGSFAKKTLIRKKKYDTDIFLRFDKKEKEISDLTRKIIKGMKAEKIHGSRDYFRIPLNQSLLFELIPVKKIRNPEEAENITDLSYSHVRYVNKKIKSEKIRDEIRLAKAFCYAKNCYGAESYIRGFSGYSLELLICYYGSFLNFLRAMAKVEKKEVIDIEKHYKTRQKALMDINTSKLESPVVLVDPTYKQRNTLAALSKETFEKFRKDCKEFLKNPSVKAFEKRKINLGKIKRDAERKNYKFILLEAGTDKQEGDIAGGKLLKFYKYLNREIPKFFEIKDRGFIYDEGKEAAYFFVAKKKKEIFYEGPYTEDKKNLMLFKKKHKRVFIKNNKSYSREKIDFSIEGFIKEWKKKNRKIMKDMKIKDLKIINLSE